MTQPDDENHNDDTDYDAIQRQNLVALLFVALLLGACLWTVNWLTTTSKLQTCIEAGHRNCGVSLPQ